MCREPPARHGPCTIKQSEDGERRESPPLEGLPVSTEGLPASLKPHLCQAVSAGVPGGRNRIAVFPLHCEPGPNCHQSAAAAAAGDCPAFVINHSPRTERQRCCDVDVAFAPGDGERHLGCGLFRKTLPATVSKAPNRAQSGLVFSTRPQLH